MDNNLLQIKVKQRLNKLASQDYGNIECWQIAEAFNKSQIEWVRRQVHGNNPRKEGDESTKMLIDDLQKLLFEKAVAVINSKLYYETELLPTDYLYFKKLSTYSITDCCKTPRLTTIYIAEVADADVLLNDSFRSPSFEWGETFATIQNDRFRIYTNDSFSIANTALTYYRKPVEVEFEGCVNPSTGVPYATDVLCEFKDDIVEMIIDDAAALLAGDIEQFNQYTRGKQNSQSNN
jgi:hypothetical protein